MSGRERGGRIRRERQHLPRHSGTPSPSPTPRRQSGTRLFSAVSRMQREMPCDVLPPPFPNLFPYTVKASTPDAVPATVPTTGSNGVFDSPATITPTPTPASQTPEYAQKHAPGTTQKISAKTTMKATATAGKRKRRNKTTPAKCPGFGRAPCGRCKFPKNHMIMVSKKCNKKADEAKGGSNKQERKGEEGEKGEKCYDDEWEDLVCRCDERSDKKRKRERNMFVEGEDPPSPLERDFTEWMVERTSL